MQSHGRKILAVPSCTIALRNSSVEVFSREHMRLGPVRPRSCPTRSRLVPFDSAQTADLYERSVRGRSVASDVAHQVAALESRCRSGLHVHVSRFFQTTSYPSLSPTSNRRF